MDYRNADGTAVEMCGNGVRVVAKTVLDRALVEAPGDVLGIDTRDGVKQVEVRRGPDGTVAEVTVDMGPPHWTPAEIPTTLDQTTEFHLDVAPETTWSAVSMGNPHVVTRVDDVATAPVTTLGPEVEHHAAFPKGTNVEFAHVRAHDLVDLRVWERGVGETQACGTGACATLAVLRADGRGGRSRHHPRPRRRPRRPLRPRRPPVGLPDRPGRGGRDGDPGGRVAASADLTHAPIDGPDRWTPKPYPRQAPTRRARTRG